MQPVRMVLEAGAGWQAGGELVYHSVSSAPHLRHSESSAWLASYRRELTSSTSRTARCTRQPWCSWLGPWRPGGSTLFITMKSHARRYRSADSPSSPGPSRFGAVLDAIRDEHGHHCSHIHLSWANVVSQILAAWIFGRDECRNWDQSPSQPLCCCPTQSCCF